MDRKRCVAGRTRRACARLSTCSTAFLLSVIVACASSADVVATSGPGAASPAADLGRRLFFDPSLSASGKLACATCHDPRFAYGPPPGHAIAKGGRDGVTSGTRAVPSLRYARNAPPFSLDHHFIDGDQGPVGGYTWDGRAGSMAEQAQLPLLAANEMANASPAEVVKRLRAATYADQFRSVFGASIFNTPERAFAAALQALDAFQQTTSEFTPYSSRYDAYLRGDIDLSEKEERGAELFKDPQKGNCASCHVVTTQEDRPPSFTDYDYANVGVPRNPRISANADPRSFDRGLCGPLRQDLAAKREYCGYFRAPTLRNVAIRDAFFHNGVFSSLRQVLEFYVERDLHPERYYSRNPDGSVHKFDDMPADQPDNVDHDPPLDRKAGQAPALSDGEIDDLMAFLQTLTDADLVRSPSQSAKAVNWREPWRLPSSRRPAARNSDEYAWHLFVALNWPADVVRRKADSRASFGAAGPVAWETWQNASDVFLEDGTDPGPWALGKAAPGAASETRFETFSLKDLKKTRHIVAGMMVPLADPLAQAQRLIEVRMNRVSFDYIRSHALYNVEGQLQAVARGRVVTFPYGAAQVKASWRPIESSERSRYHTITVRFANGTSRLYGLTALNIAAKALPNWFWASFEHVDNASRRNGDGWQLPSRDAFACRDAPDCNRAPAGIGLEGTVWENYRLRGTLTSFVDTDGRPRLLANSELEAGLQMSASCITCHSRAAIGVVDGHPARLPVFAPASADGQVQRRGYVGLPQSETGFKSLDFVWSLAQAKSRAPDVNIVGDSP